MVALTKLDCCERLDDEDAIKPALGPGEKHAAGPLASTKPSCGGDQAGLAASNFPSHSSVMQRNEHHSGTLASICPSCDGQQTGETRRGEAKAAPFGGLLNGDRKL